MPRNHTHHFLVVVTLGGRTAGHGCDDLDVAGVITASEPSWIAPFTGLSPRNFGKLVTVLRREGADAVCRGRPRSLPLEDRALPVAAYWRTNLTMRQLAPLFGVSKSAADRVINHLGPMLALQPRKRFTSHDTVRTRSVTLTPPHNPAGGNRFHPRPPAQRSPTAKQPQQQQTRRR